MLISTNCLLAQNNLSPRPTNSIQKDSVKTIKTDSLRNTNGEESLEKPIIYRASDSIRYETKGKKIYLFGDGFVQYEDMSLNSAIIEIDNEKNTVTAYGKTDSLGKNTGTPRFKDASQEIACRKMIYNLQTKKGKIFDVMTKEGDLLLKGNEVKKDSNNIVYMKNLSCIPCQFEDSKTIFKASKAKIIPNDKIVTGPMYLEIGGVPTPLGLPFGFFPNTKKRHSGLLIPFYGNSDALGFYLKDGGFYWGINEKTDMAIRGDIYSNGSWGLRTLNNYKVNYKFNGSISLGYSEFRNGEIEIPTSYSKQKDLSINWRHFQDQKSNPTIRFTSDVNIRTSKYNTLNALNSGQYLTNTFQSNVNFGKTFKIGSLGINARHDQNTQTRIMNLSFPEVTFNINRFYPFKKENRIKQNPIDKIGISYLFEARNTLSGLDTTIFKGHIADSLKYGFRHTLPISTNINLFKYLTLTPALNLSGVMYTKTTRKELNEVTNRINTTTDKNFKTGYDANFNTALSTKLFMDYLFKGNRVKQIRHLLIPNLTYSYRPDFGEEQYGFWKEVISDTILRQKNKYSVFENTLFNGPAQGSQNSLGINLNNNLEAKIRQKTDTGFVFRKVSLIQNLSLNGSYNFAADSFKMSLISVNGRTKIWKFFDLLFNSTFDPYYSAIITNTLTRIESGHRTNQYLWNKNGRLVDFQSGNIAINATFNSAQDIFKIKNPNLTNGAEQVTENSSSQKQQEQLPWSLNAYYNVSFTKILGKIKDIQTLNLSGDISVTKFWKLGITSGYDFTNKYFSYTSINVMRDLRCWQARIDWVPFGFRKSYSITINLKTSMLSDIKIPRQRQWYDNF